MGLFKIMLYCEFGKIEYSLISLVNAGLKIVHKYLDCCVLNLYIPKYTIMES